MTPGDLSVRAKQSELRRMLDVFSEGQVAAFYRWHMLGVEVHGTTDADVVDGLLLVITAPWDEENNGV